MQKFKNENGGIKTRKKSASRYVRVLWLLIILFVIVSGFRQFFMDTTEILEVSYFDGFGTLRINKIDKLPADKSLGLGEFITKKVDNDRKYSWYVNQGDTGKFSSTNCGPACAEMIGKWIDKDFQGTAEEARKLDYCDEGGWFTENIQNYLAKYEIESRIIANVSKEKIIFNLQNGNIVVLALKIGEISLNDPKENSEHTGRFYESDGGHFIIVKGYVVVDGVTYFKVYDPNSWEYVYGDDSPMGKDRYFLADEVVEASKVWYDELLLIRPK